MSNMYEEYQGKTINFVGGECIHRCKYCYVKSLMRFPETRERYSGRLKLIEDTFKKNLGKGKSWFVCSCNDICAIPEAWAIRILKRLNEFPDNTYLIQSKNPLLFNNLMEFFPPKTILGTTAETNRNYDLSKAPQPADRLIDFAYLETKFPKMISIEPILDFGLSEFAELIRRVKPLYVSIGADSKGYNLNEPTAEKVDTLIRELRKFTEVRIKSNLKKRFIGEEAGKA